MIASSALAGIVVIYSMVVETYIETLYDEIEREGSIVKNFKKPTIVIQRIDQEDIMMASDCRTEALNCLKCYCAAVTCDSVICDGFTCTPMYDLLD